MCHWGCDGFAGGGSCLAQWWEVPAVRRPLQPSCRCFFLHEGACPGCLPGRADRQKTNKGFSTERESFCNLSPVHVQPLYHGSLCVGR